jgi:hypothetical protein
MSSELRPQTPGAAHAPVSGPAPASGRAPTSGVAAAAGATLAIAVMLAFAPAARAAEAAAGDLATRAALSLDIPHTSESPEIDGRLDEALWKDALVIELDIEVNPRENEPAPVATFAYLIEDGSRLLVAFDARDPEPDKIRAYLRDRDSAFNDDFVGIVLDTFNDQRRAFEFFVNPLGVQMDLTVDDVNNNGGEDASWDAIWESAGAVNEHGYVVEFAIPFSQLRFQRTEGPQVWGIDALRVYPRENRALLTANPRERGRNCYLCQIGKVRGFANAEPGRGLEVVPSFTTSRTDSRDAALGRLANGNTDSDVGANVRWSITPDLVANLALNPDFSQVEADVAQLDVNNQFALFFPETRPFFLEGADFFATPINAVFTRTIADPDIGAKLTGTSGPNTFGVFAAEDTTTNLLFPGALGSSTETLDQDSRTIVGRYRRNFGANSTIGALVTSRSGDDYDNRVAGFDGRYRANDRHSVRFQYLNSDTQYPDAIVADADLSEGDFSGDAVQINYEYGTREWFAFTNYHSFDSGFRADSGFVSQVDFEGRNAGFGRIWHGDGSAWWNQLRIGANTGSRHDQAGGLLVRWRETFFSFQGPLQSFAQIGFVDQQESWGGQRYDLRRVWSYGQFRPSGALNLNLSFNVGDQIDFANSRLGEQLRLAPSVTWNIGRHLLSRLQYTAVRFEDQAGAPIFDADLVDLRLTWQFSVRSLLRLTLQQQLIERNLALFTSTNVDARSKTRGTELLYSYRLNPQTVVYAGYSDSYAQDDEFTSLTEMDRTFFLKLSYAWAP